MNEFLAFAFFGSIMWFWVFIVVLFSLSILFEYNRNGYIALTSLGIFLGINYFWGNIPIMNYVTWFNVGMYFFIGFLYSLIRTYFSSRHQDIQKYELKNNVLRWWTMWCISFPFWLCSDLISNLFDLIYDKIGKLYESIFDFATPKAKNETRR